ncbi:MAG: transketolase [Desulfotignum sp.]|nr:transketolase [Desulfotignum sp.]MCF8088689.1 transketolase [Desulfotignum sp.]MCF8136419.1 transketolase [Desulfotignum sp.]
MNRNKISQLSDQADSLRRHIITMNCYAGSGHPGGALSAVEIIVYLFSEVLRINSGNPHDPNRDRFILSKGHACLVLYAALADKGFFSPEEFKKLRHVGGMLQGHPDRLKTPGVEFNSGSLGQGFSFALGCALGAKLTKCENDVYVLLGDGEMNEGQIWEGLMFGAFHHLDNLVAIVDYNKLQSDDYSRNVTGLEPLYDKLVAFGWHVQEIDGHDFLQIGNAFDLAKKKKKQPSIILAHTVKGKGISFMENVPKWHGSLCPTGKEQEKAFIECGLENR